MLRGLELWQLANHSETQKKGLNHPIGYWWQGPSFVKVAKGNGKLGHKSNIILKFLANVLSLRQLTSELYLLILLPTSSPDGINQVTK
jgi:hypothetical protein